MPIPTLINHRIVNLDFQPVSVLSLYAVHVALAEILVSDSAALTYLAYWE